MLRCIRATTRFRGIKEPENRKGVNLLPDANPLEEGGIHPFGFGGMICSHRNCAFCRCVTYNYVQKKCQCVRGNLPKISHGHQLLPCHSQADRGMSGWSTLSRECECTVGLYVRMYGFRHDTQTHTHTHRMPGWTCFLPASPVRPLGHLTSYFEPFHPRRKSLSSRLPCSHFPCPPTWNWGFTALIAKVVPSFAASAFHHERLLCQMGHNFDSITDNVILYMTSLIYVFANVYEWTSYCCHYPTIKWGISVCLSLCLLFAHLQNHSSNRIHIWQVCCWGTRGSAILNLAELGHMARSTLKHLGYTTNMALCSEQGCDSSAPASWLCRLKPG